MKFTINLRFLLASLLCFALVGLATYLVHGVQVKRQSAFLLDRARQYAADPKQVQPAVRDYQLYLQLVPKDVEAHADFGLLLAEHGHLPMALIHLETALRSLPDRDTLRRKLVELDIALNLYSAAREHLQFLLNAFPGDSKLWAQFGVCQEAGGQYPEAAESFRKAIAIDPKQCETYVRLADVLRLRLDRIQDADDCIDNLVGKNPDSALAHKLRARYLLYRTTNKEKLALSDAEKAVALSEADLSKAQKALDEADSSKLKKGAAWTEAEQAGRDAKKADCDTKKVFHASVSLLAAKLAESVSDFDKARGFAQRAIEADVTAPDGYLARYRIERRSNRADEAVKALRDGIDRVPNGERWELSWDLGQLMVEQLKLGEAEKVIKQLGDMQLSKDFDQTMVDYLKGQLEAAKGHWYAASQLFEMVARQLAQPGENTGPDRGQDGATELLKEVEYRLARCYEQLGDSEAELAAFRKAARIDPLWVPARLGVASALSSMGQISEALEEYKQIGGLKGMAAQADFEVARLLALKNLRLHAEQRDWKDVEAILNRLQAATPDETNLTLLRAECLFGQGKSAETEKLLTAARDQHPEKTELWSALVSLAGRRQQWDRASELLDEAEKKFGDRVFIRLARGQFLLTRHGKNAAADLAKLGAESSKFSAEDRLQLHRELAMYLWEIGDLDHAKQLAAQACEADRTNLNVRLLLFELTFLSKDASLMEKVLAEIQAFQKEGALWHYGEAVRLAVLAETEPDAARQADGFRLAIEHLSKAREQRPGWSRIPLLAAQLYDHLGKIDPAIENYCQAIEAGETGEATVHRAFVLLYKRQRYAEADAMLRRLEQRQAVFFTKLGRLASDVSMRLENFDRAVEISRQAADQSQDWADHLWLGELQGLLGRRALADQLPEQARMFFLAGEKSLRRAVELGPNTPETWVGLVRFLASTGSQAAAQSLMDEAIKKIPADKAALALGPCYEALGKLDEATKQYKLLLASGEKDPRTLRNVAEFCIRVDKPKEAEEYLQRILGGQVAAKPDDITWARRAMASILRQRGGYANLLKAVALVEQNRAAGEGPDDLQERAMLLAAFPQRAMRQQAIEALEQVVKSQPQEMAEVRFSLAKLYLRDKNWSKANEHMRALLANHGKEVRFLEAYVAMLMDHNEMQEAGLWLNRLEELTPDNSVTLRIEAEAAIRRQQPDQAIEMLHKFLERPTSTQRLTNKEVERDARIVKVVSILKTVADGAEKRGEKAAQTLVLAEMERLVREYVTRHPETDFLIPFVLLQQGRTDEALDLAEASWPKADVKALTAEASGLVGSVNLRSSQNQRLEQLLLRIADKSNRPVEILLVIGSLQMREHPQDAAQTYREVLAKDENNIIALNNLAVVLALQKVNVDEAQRLVNRAIDIAGPVPAMLDTRALVRMASGQVVAAVADLDEAIQDDPRQTLYFHRALASWQIGRKGDTPEAVRETQKRAATEAFREARRLGLKPEGLHPLERADYDALAASIPP
jgi:cellulose synthase operon protein C